MKTRMLRAIKAVRNKYDHGRAFFNTAEVYSPGLSGIFLKRRFGVLSALAACGSALNLQNSRFAPAKNPLESSFFPLKTHPGKDMDYVFAL